MTVSIHVRPSRAGWSWEVHKFGAIEAQGWTLVYDDAVKAAAAAAMRR